MKRREFLITGLAGALTAPVIGAAPCPPSRVTAVGGTTATTSCGGTPSPQVFLISPLTQSLAPFTVGQAFKMRDVPSGAYIAANIPNFQADVKNLWSDGSVKFAVLSGRVNTTANQLVTIQLSSTTTAPSGTPPSLATLQSIVTNGNITFSGGASGTVDLPTVIGSVTPFRSGYNSGSQMSEWHWRVPVGSDPFLEVWLFIRLYAGGQVEIETCVENGHIRVANPSTKSYAVSVTYNSTQRYSGSLTHYYQSRWSRVDWYGADPQITPAQNTQYLRATLLVPNYSWNGIAAADLNALTQSYTPLTLPNLPTAMGNTGAQGYIGLLQQCDAMYVTSNGDARAYNAVMATARGLGTYQIHFRDEGTHLPLLFASYPNLCVNQNANNIGANPPSSTGDFTPQGSGTQSIGTWDFPHHPAPGYLAYLLSGRRIFVDQLQFATTAHYLSIGDNSRQFSACVFDSTSAGTVRGAAWNLRTLGMTAAMTPDADPLRAQFQAAWAANMSFYVGKYVTGTTYGGQYVNPFGMVMMYQTNGSTVSEYNSGSGHLWAAAWMQAFFGATQGFTWDMEVTTDAVSRGQHLQLRNFVYQHAVGLAGDDSGFNYRRGGPYAMVYTLTENSSPISWCTSWAQIKQIYEAFSALATISGAGTLKQHDSDSDITGGDSSSPPDGYWANMLPALAYAVHHGATGAAAGLARIQASPSWTYTSSFNHDPTWGVLPS
jgi:hypothetical protein